MKGRRMQIGDVTIGRGLRLSCPYARGTLTVRLGALLVAATIIGMIDSCWWFYAAAAQPGAPQGLARLLICIALLLVNPVGVLLLTGCFLRHQLWARPVPPSSS
jgi:hypothetical protein